MRCIHCNTQNREGVQFCEYCGEKIVTEPQKSTAQWSCANCGHENKAEYKFCEQCGIEPDLNTDTGLKPLHLLISTAVLCLVILSGYLFARNLPTFASDTFSITAAKEKEIDRVSSFAEAVIQQNYPEYSSSNLELSLTSLDGKEYYTVDVEDNRQKGHYPLRLLIDRNASYFIPYDLVLEK